MKNIGYKCYFFAAAYFFLIILLFLHTGNYQLHAQDRVPQVNSNDIKDYICIVNTSLHPNMERYLNFLIRECIESGDVNLDNYASELENIKRGNRGSGFLYLDQRGNNYIITNYHAIVGAYRLAVTFENEKGEKTVYQNLSVLGINEAWDLAILAFPDGQKPFRRGLTLSTAQQSSGITVYAAGYPWMSGVPVWIFYQGSIINPRTMPPREVDWFIQHNAPMNPGNSGGPLLIEDRRSPLRYSVIGINTFLSNLQGANFAIPAERLEIFIQRSLEQTVSFESRLEAFMQLLVRSTTTAFAYRELSSFLSSTMINADPISAATSTMNFDSIANEVHLNPINGISWAVAYSMIENPVYKSAQKPLAQRSAPPEIIFKNDNYGGGYTVKILINGYPYRTEWIREYGTWKLDEFILDDGEYNDNYQFATPHPLNKKVIYSFSSLLDHDWYILEVPRAGRLIVRTEGNITDPYLELYDARNNKLDENDDFPGRGLNALVSANVQRGTYYVRARAVGNPGEYILLAGFEDDIIKISDTAVTTVVIPLTSPQITIINNTGYPVKSINISPVTSDTWDENRLSSNQILRSGQSLTLSLPFPIEEINRYDIRLIDTDDDFYIKMNVLVTAGGRIEFTFNDFQGL